MKDLWFGLGLLVAVGLTALAAYDGWTAFVTVPLGATAIMIALAWLGSQAEWFRRR